MTVKLENQPIVFGDNCEINDCRCGSLKCDKFALMTDEFAFQIPKVMAWGAGTPPDIDVIKFCDDTVIDTLEETDFFLTSETIVSFKATWDDYVSDEGCYYFRIYDVDNSVNGTWETDLSGWTPVGTGTATWSSDTPGAKLSGGASGGSGVIYQDYSGICILDGTISFQATTTANIVVGLYVNGSLVNAVNVNNETKVISYNIPDGTVVTNVTISCLIGISEVITFFNYTITTDYVSNPICVYDELHFCNTYINAYSSTNHSDFEFETSGFEFFMRLKSRIVNPRYPTEEEIYLASNGANSLPYARSEKHYDYQIERAAESTWDALTSIMMCDTILIDGVQYRKVEGDIEPSWQKSNNKMASGTITIKKQTENRKK